MRPAPPSVKPTTATRTPMRREVLCAGCGFPARRGKVPIIWPSNVSGRQAYCSVACWEKVAEREMPEPMRSLLLDVCGG